MVDQAYILVHLCIIREPQLGACSDTIIRERIVLCTTTVKMELAYALYTTIIGSQLSFSLNVRGLCQGKT